jgi:hypothetical protein
MLYVKGKLIGYRTDSASELFVHIEEILEEIECNALNAVFDE